MPRLLFELSLSLESALRRMLIPSLIIMIIGQTGPDVSLAAREGRREGGRRESELEICTRINPISFKGSSIISTLGRVALCARRIRRDSAIDAKRKRERERDRERDWIPMN